MSEIETLRQELAEARRQQEAMAEVLEAVAQTSYDRDEMLRRLLRTAAGLCGADIGVIALVEGDELVGAISLSGDPADEAFVRRFRLSLANHANLQSIRSLLSGEPLQNPDTYGSPGTYTEARDHFKFAALLSVPMMRDGRGVGVFSLSRSTPGLFTDAQVALARGFAAQAVIAIVNAQRMEELERQRAEMAAAYDREAVSAEVMRAINRSRVDLSAVLDQLTRSAVRLSGLDMGGLFVRQGDFMIPHVGERLDPETAAFLRANPIPFKAATILAQAARTGESLEVVDFEEPIEKTYRDRFDYRALLHAPMMADGECIGVLSVARRLPGPFTERQKSVIRSFAEQAAIAIRNLRLFKDLEARTAELNEALEQQTATAETLKTLSRSAFDLDAVLNTLVQSAMSLCNANAGGLVVRDGGEFRMRALRGHIPENAEQIKRRVYEPGRYSVAPRVLLSGAVEMISDATLDPEFEYPGPVVENRSFLGVPLLQDKQIIGVFVLNKREPGGFSERQIELIKTFADQAVIAIGNVALFKDLEARTAELNATLEQQTATAETLKTLSRSAFDLDTVLTTLLSSAVKLCNGEIGGLALRINGEYRMRTTVGFDDALESWARSKVFAPDRSTVVSRVLMSGDIEMVVDLQDDAEVTAKGLMKARSIMGVPMLRDGEIEGVLVLSKLEPVGFTEREIELVRTFADQAVIAIGNVNLFKDLEARTTELNDALEQQTATAETLKTLSRSVFDLDAVLNTLLQSAIALCAAETGTLAVRENGEFRAHAVLGQKPENAARIRASLWRPGRDHIVPRVLLSRAVEMIPDATLDPEFVYPGFRHNRSFLGVPLLNGEELLGVFVLGRPEPGGFTERQIELVKTFADQAVIAIGNVKLFEDLEARTAELNAALEQQTATAETLKTLSRSAFDLDAVLETLVNSAVALCGAESGGLTIRDSGEYRMRALVGFAPVMQEKYKREPIIPGRGKVVGRALLSGEVQHVLDSFQDPELMQDLPPGIPMSHRSLLSVPLFKDSEILGAILVRRRDPGGFTDRQIELVKTFADQAVIALGNVQLFKDLETRTRELRRSLDDLRATQDRLIQSEKLASLGQLTAGVAHEIKNPLNFVNNFSKLAVELMEELGDALRSAELPQHLKDEVEDLSQSLTDSMAKIHHHGQRADSIVKNMLLHARQDGGERRPVDLNALIEESLNLAYHGARAERRDFTIALRRDLDPAIGEVTLFPQGFTRVLLNLFSNGFYAALSRAGEPGFTPLLQVSTRALTDQVEIRVRDNGKGVPEAIREKLFTPFFTTKPAGEGTGLGLSLSYEIIVQQHGGSLSFETETGAFTEFLITLPRDIPMESN